MSHQKPLLVKQKRKKGMKLSSQGHVIQIPWDVDGTLKKNTEKQSPKRINGIFVSSP